MTEDQHARFEARLVIVGEEAWLPEEWAAEQVRRELARPRTQRYNARRSRRVTGLMSRQGNRFSGARPESRAGKEPT